MVSHPKVIIVGCRNKQFAVDTLQELLPGYEYKLEFIFDQSDAHKVAGIRDVPWLYFTLPYETYEVVIERLGLPNSLKQVKEYLNGNKDWASVRVDASTPSLNRKD